MLPLQTRVGSDRSSSAQHDNMRGFPRLSTNKPTLHSFSTTISFRYLNPAVLSLTIPGDSLPSSMTESSDFKETVKQQADIVRIVGDYVKLKKAGAQNYSGLCPFHNEKTPSFSVHATRQFYHCFGCGVSGDVFSFVQKVENITFPEAVRTVAQKLGIALPKVSYCSPAEAKEARLRTVLLMCTSVPALSFRNIFAGRKGPCARISARARIERRRNQNLPHRLRPGFGLCLARSLERRVRRRGAARERCVFVEGGRWTSDVSPQPSAKHKVPRLRSG